jgi:hypothetical protein
MGSTRSGASTPWWAMIEDSADEFFMTLSGEGSFSLPSPRRHDMGASLAPITTTPCMKDAPTTQTTMMVPPQMASLRPKTGLSFERHHTCHKGQQAQACARQPIAEQWVAPQSSKLAVKPVATVV